MNEVSAEFTLKYWDWNSTDNSLEEADSIVGFGACDISKLMSLLPRATKIEKRDTALNKNIKKCYYKYSKQILHHKIIVEAVDQNRGNNNTSWIKRKD